MSIVLFLAIITIESATTKNYFNYKDGNDNKKNIYRDKYDEERAKYKKKITHQDTLCDDPYLQSMETYAKDMNIPRC